MLKRILPVLFFFFVAPQLFSQATGVSVFDNTCTISGSAPGREGNVIGAYMYDDYVTYTENKLAETVVDDSGKFSLTVEVNEVSYIFLKCRNRHGFLFAEPGRKIELEFPDGDPKDFVNPEVDYEVPCYVYINDSTDMNFLADDYKSKFDLWWKGVPTKMPKAGTNGRDSEIVYMNPHFQYFIAKDSLSVIDSFRVEMDKHYSFVKNPYFKPWMDYGIASIEDGVFHSQLMMGKKYILNQPIYYHNSEYMEFFNNFFHDYMYKWSARREGQQMISAVNNLISYDSLFSAMKRLPWMETDSIRELVMLKGLFESYHNPVYNPRNILAVALQASTRSRIAEHRHIARNIVAFYSKLKRGTAAPDFIAKNKAGVEIDPLTTYKGKYIYVFFFATWNEHAMSEFRYMADLQKKYGKKIMFVSVSLDEDTNAYKAFLKANPKYNWLILHYDFQQKIKEDYNLFDVPAGYLIDPDGKLFLSPADNPSGDLEYVLYKICNPKAPPFQKPGCR